VARFLAAKKKENLAEATIYKLTSIFEKQMLSWARASRITSLEEIGAPELELRKVLMGREFLRRADSINWGAHFSQGTLVLSSRASRGLADGGLSSIVVNRLN
jgi:hypothetical protein